MHYSEDVYILRENNSTTIASILDSPSSHSASPYALRILYPWTPQADSTENDPALAYSNAEDFCNNYYRALLDLSEEKHLNSYEFNSLCWEEYDLTSSSGTKFRYYITVKDNIPFILNFRLLDTYANDALTEEQWNEIIENRDSLMLSIVSSMNFTDNDNQYVYKENEVATYDTITYPSQLGKDVYGNFFAIKDGISIDNVFDQILSDTGYSADSSYSYQTGMYVFLTTDSYGYVDTTIYSDMDIRLYTNYIDFIVKNFSQSHFLFTYLLI